MKALDEYFLMVVFTLSLNRVHVFANFMCNLDRKTWQRKGQESFIYLFEQWQLFRGLFFCHFFLSFDSIDFMTPELMFLCWSLRQ